MSPGSTGDGLRATLRDLVALLALPALWRARDPAYIAASLADLLMHLLRLDLAYVRLEDPTSGRVVEELRPAGLAAGLGDVIRAALGAGDRASIDHPDGGRVRLARAAPGVEPGRWFVAGGCRREDYPDETDGFLLRAAAEQAGVAVENVRLYRQAEEASQAKSRFLAMMSHELRTPLNGIMGYVDLMDAGVSGPLTDTQARQLGRIRAGARHLIDLVEEILTFSRIEAGQERLHLEAVDLASLLRETCEMVRPMAEQKGLAFQCGLPGSTVDARTDSAKLRQILLNLLGNAIKFTERGSVELSLSTQDGQAAIAVRDTGVGIAAHQLERIFEPFHQLEQGLTRTLPGTGLGLTVTRSLAALLGGGLDVASVPGEGSTFTVHLPLRGPPDSRPPG